MEITGTLFCHISTSNLFDGDFEFKDIEQDFEQDYLTPADIRVRDFPSIFAIG